MRKLTGKFTANAGTVHVTIADKLARTVPWST